MNDAKANVVSVLVPLYNHSSTVQRALASVLLSDATRIELITCDDASVDDSFEVATKWMESHRERFYAISVLQNEKNLGITGNLNRLKALATGEFVTLLASDDELTAGTIDRQREFLVNRPNVDFVFANFGTIDEDSRVVCPQVLTARHVSALQRQPWALVDVVFNWSPYWTRLFARRRAFAALGPYPTEYSFEDRWAALKIAQTRRFLCIHEVVYLYRQRGTGWGTAGLDRERLLRDTLSIEDDLRTRSTGLLAMLLAIHLGAYVRTHRWAPTRVLFRALQKVILHTHRALGGDAFRLPVNK